jgi:hypothetical protein
MFAGALIGGVAAAVALGLFLFGFRRLSPTASRVLASIVCAAAAFGTLLMLPVFIVMFSGKGTNGETFSIWEIPFWVFPFIIAPPGTAIAMVVRLVKGFPVSPPAA